MVFLQETLPQIISYKQVSLSLEDFILVMSSHVLASFFICIRKKKQQSGSERISDPPPRTTSLFIKC